MFDKPRLHGCEHPIFFPYLFLLCRIVIILTLTAANFVEAGPGPYHFKEKRTIILIEHPAQNCRKTGEEERRQEILERNLLWEKKT